MGFMWGSRGGVILDNEGSSAEVTSNTVLSELQLLLVVQYQEQLYGGME